MQGPGCWWVLCRRAPAPAASRPPPGPPLRGHTGPPVGRLPGPIDRLWLYQAAADQQVLPRASKAREIAMQGVLPGGLCGACSRAAIADLTSQTRFCEPALIPGVSFVAGAGKARLAVHRRARSPLLTHTHAPAMESLAWPGGGGGSGPSSGELPDGAPAGRPRPPAPTNNACKSLCGAQPAPQAPPCNNIIQLSGPPQPVPHTRPHPSRAAGALARRPRQPGPGRAPCRRCADGGGAPRPRLARARPPGTCHLLRLPVACWCVLRERQPAS